MNSLLKLLPPGFRPFLGPLALGLVTGLLFVALL